MAWWQVSPDHPLGESVCRSAQGPSSSFVRLRRETCQLFQHLATSTPSRSDGTRILGSKVHQGRPLEDAYITGGWRPSDRAAKLVEIPKRFLLRWSRPLRPTTCMPSGGWLFLDPRRNQPCAYQLHTTTMAIEQVRPTESVRHIFRGWCNPFAHLFDHPSVAWALNWFAPLESIAIHIIAICTIVWAISLHPTTLSRSATAASAFR